MLKYGSQYRVDFVTVSQSALYDSFRAAVTKRSVLSKFSSWYPSPNTSITQIQSNIQFQSNHTVVLVRFSLLCLTAAAAAASITTTTASSTSISSGAAAPVTSRVSAIVAPDVGCSVVVVIVAAAGAATAVLLLVCHGWLCRIIVACGRLLLSEEWETHCCCFAL